MYTKLYNFYKWYKGYLEIIYRLFKPKGSLSLYPTFFFMLFLFIILSAIILHLLNQDLMSICEIDSAMFAIMAAILWLLSAMVRTPDKFGLLNSLTFDKTEKGVRMQIGNTVIHPDFSQKMNHLSYALRTQGILSALAAICAALSAIYQAS